MNIMLMALLLQLLMVKTEQQSIHMTVSENFQRQRNQMEV